MAVARKFTTHKTIQDSITYKPTEPALAMIHQYTREVGLLKHLQTVQSLLWSCAEDMRFPKLEEYQALADDIRIGNPDITSQDDITVEMFTSKPTVAEIGIERFDKAAKRIKSADFILIGGSTNSGKTMYLCWLALRQIIRGNKVLFVSGEMPKSDIFARVMSFQLEENPDVFLDLEPDDEVGQEIVDGLIKRFHGEIAGTGRLEIVERSDLDNGFYDIVDMARDYDIVLVDGIYLFRAQSSGDSDSWQQFLALSNKIKSNTLKTKIPFVCTSQLKRGATGTTVDDFAYSSALTQDADIVMTIVEEEDDDDKEKVVRLVKNRRGDKDISTYMSIQKEPFKLLWEASGSGW